MAQRSASSSTASSSSSTAIVISSATSSSSSNSISLGSNSTRSSSASSKKSRTELRVEYGWDLNESIAQQVNCDVQTIKNVVKLFDEDNTIPFIARYRREQTNGMEPEKLREVKEQLDELRDVQAKIAKVIVKVEKLGEVDPKLKTALLSSKTADEVELLYAPFKSTGKRLLADRARELGLEVYARQLISSCAPVNLRGSLNTQEEGLSSVEVIEEGVQHIIADIITKDKDTLRLLRELCTTAFIKLCSKMSTTLKKTLKSPKVQKKNVKKKTSSAGPKLESVKKQAQKFELYADFCFPVKQIKPHQVLAINRGESLKVLKVSVDIPENVRQRFLAHCRTTYVPKGADAYACKLVMASAEDGYRRRVVPFMTRTVRSILNETAEKASISVFASNLKHLLLTQPVRGKSILGLDPGFLHGCKYALVSGTGQVKATGVAFLHDNKSVPSVEIEKLRKVLTTFNCETIAIGNGVGCRETELLLSDCIKRSVFRPLCVTFCIVSESGASIYSASDLAKQELPDLDIAVRGAVSIARRLQDPLAELVKIDPKSIGVGMYQHDLTEKKLQLALDGVVEDCVSFVGADLNVTGEVLLKNVAGIGASMAKKIVAHREENGPFVNRSQLLCVAGLGPKTFKQCAGFLRIMPHVEVPLEQNGIETVEVSGANVGKKRKLKSDDATGKKKLKLSDVDCCREMLDTTWIHPESYSIADELIQMTGLNKEHIGQSLFIKGLRSFLVFPNDVGSLSVKLKCSVETLQLIIDGLMQPVGYDFRDDHEKPLFKQSVTSLEDLKAGAVLSGKVTNVTHFGAFVDIGVGTEGLIHVSAVRSDLLHGRAGLNLGDVVEVLVMNVDLSRKRISLKLNKLLS